MGVFDRQIETARRLIAKNGEICVWREMVNAAGSEPWKPSDPAEIDVPKHDVKICWVPEATIRNMFDSEVPRLTYYGLMSVQDFRPSIQDDIQRSDGSRAKVEWLTELNPNGAESILWAIGAGGP